MKLYLEKEDSEREIKLEVERQLKEILKDLNISLSSVILVKNGNVCLEDEMVCNQDDIKILSVVSGG